jgi:hypothetical protein
MDVATFEQRVFEVDGVLIRIRASKSDKVDDFNYNRAASGTTTVSDWMRTRILPSIGNFECDVISGQYGQVHGNTQLERLRSTYR